MGDMSEAYTLIFEPALNIDVRNPDAQSVMLASSDDFQERTRGYTCIFIPLPANVFQAIVEPEFECGHPIKRTMENYYAMVLAPEFYNGVKKEYGLLRGDMYKLEAARDEMHKKRAIKQGSIYTILHSLCMRKVPESFFEDAPSFDATEPIGVDAKVTVAAILKVLAARGEKIERVALKVALVSEASEPTQVYFVWTPKP
jgi:hypothetical protein